MNEKTTYYLLLTDKKGDYIVLASDDNKDVIESNLNWYNAHKKFFNGSFSIEEITL